MPWDVSAPDALGITAENVANEYSVFRQDQDAFAVRSQDAAAGRHQRRASRRRWFRLKSPPGKARRASSTSTNTPDRTRSRNWQAFHLRFVREARSPPETARASTTCATSPRRVRGGDRATRSHPHRPGRRLGDRRRSSPPSWDWTEFPPQNGCSPGRVRRSRTWTSSNSTKRLPASRSPA